MVACLNELWSEKFREFWRDNCLVNISESPKGFMSCDGLGEYIVREIKSLVHHNRTEANDEYLRRVLSRFVMDLLHVRRNIMNVIDVINYYQHSSNVRAFYDVRMVVNILLKQNVFDRSPDASQIPIKNTDATSDLYGSGMAEIWDGVVICNYKDAMEKGGLYNDNENDESEMDDMVVYEENDQMEMDDDVVVYEENDDTDDMNMDDV
jgi:hypothetical protein